MNTNKLSVQEKDRLVKMGAWFKDVRETGDMNQKEFARWLGVKDAVVRAIEEGRSPIDEWIQKAIARRTGRRFGEKLPDQEVQETKAKVLEFLDAKDKRQAPKVSKVPAKVDRVPCNMEERIRVQHWLRYAISVRGLTQAELAIQAGVKSHVLRDLLHCKTRLQSDVQERLEKATNSIYSIDNPLTGPEPMAASQAELPEPEGSPIFDEEVQDFQEKFIAAVAGMEAMEEQIQSAGTLTKDPPVIFGEFEGHQVVPMPEDAHYFGGRVNEMPEPEDTPQVVTCSPICAEYNIAKGNRNVFLKVNHFRKTFTLQNGIHDDEFKFIEKEIRELTEVVADAELILAAVRLAQKELNIT